VHDALRVRRRQTSTHLPEERERLAHRELALLHEERLEIAPIEQLDDDARAAVRRSQHVHDVHHVIALHAAHRARLAVEAHEEIVSAGVIAVDDLHGVAPIESHVLGHVHATHAAFAEHARDAEGPREDRTDHRVFARARARERAAVERAHAERGGVGVAAEVAAVRLPRGGGARALLRREQRAIGLGHATRIRQEHDAEAKRRLASRRISPAR
jgi:hypothetical protein